MKRIRKTLKGTSNKNSTVPKRVKVGPYKYVIKEVPNLTLENEPVFGYIDLANQVIKIEQKLKLQAKKVTLLHELCHGILFNAGIIKLTPELHKVVDSISCGLVEIIDNNKTVAKLLEEKERTS